MKLKPFHASLVGILLGGAVVPLFVYAAFTGTCKTVTGALGTSPTDCNVPGVIWNIKGILPPPPPQEAQISITGELKGSHVYADTKDSFLLKDVYLKSGSAFRVDQSPLSVFNIGNWDLGSSKPFTLNLNGGLKVDSLTVPGGLGFDGRVQAKKFCFNPGGASDCVTSWSGSGGPGGGGSFVSKTGDAMTGALQITASSPGFGNAPLVVDRTDVGPGLIIKSATGAEFQNKNGDTTYVGLPSAGFKTAITPADSIGIDIRANGLNSVGGSIQGNKRGLIVKSGGFTSDAIALYADNAAIAGSFHGREIGVRGFAPAPGAYSGVAEAVGVFGASTNTAGTNIGVKGIGTGTDGRGGDFTGSNFGILSKGEAGGSYFSNGSGGYTFVAYPGYGIYTNQAMSTAGDLSAPSNTPENCAWQTVDAGSGDFICSTNKFLTGVRKNAGDVVTAMYCCNL